MIALNKPVEMLESILEKIEGKIETLKDKDDIILAKAMERESGELTAKEETRHEELRDKWVALDFEAMVIMEALEALREYTK